MADSSASVSTSASSTISPVSPATTLSGTTLAGTPARSPGEQFLSGFSSPVASQAGGNDVADLEAMARFQQNLTQLEVAARQPTPRRLPGTPVHVALESDSDIQAQGGAGAGSEDASIMQGSVGVDDATAVVPPPPEIKFVRQKLLAERRPHCMNCMREVDPIAKGVRLRKKTTQEYWCGGCNSRNTTMSRQVDGWPTMEFKSMPEDKQVAFWRLDGGSKDFRFAYADALAREEVERQRGYCDRQFRPLDYWVRIGYCGERIQANALPHQIDNSDPMVGTQYQVAARGQIDEHEIATKRSQILQKLMKKTSIKRKVKAADPDAAGSDSLSSSDDAPDVLTKGSKKREEKRKTATNKSQDDAEREKKRKRENEKEAAQAAKKASLAESVRLKQEASRLKEVNKVRDRNAATTIELATKTAAKLERSLSRLTTLLCSLDGSSKPQTAQLPQSVFQESSDSLKKLTEIRKQCQSRMDDMNAMLLFSMEQVRETMTETTGVLTRLEPFAVLLDVAIDE